MVANRPALVWIKLLIAVGFVLLLLAELGFALHRLREAKESRTTTASGPSVGRIFKIGSTPLARGDRSRS
jgi:hypothetical protein